MSVVSPTSLSWIIASPGDGWNERDSVPTLPIRGETSAVLIHGVAVENQPPAVHIVNKSGVVCPMFSTDWYNRVHVTPQILELGNVTSGQVRTFEVWNAFLDQSKTLQTITPTGNTDGILLTEPDPTPSVYGPLELKTFQLDFFTNGPATINVVYALDFTTVQPTVTISGRRAILFGFEPNWEAHVLETLSWLTNILETTDGLEYRQRLRTIPRRSFEFDVAVQTSQKRLLEQYLWAWKARSFILPIWTDCDPLTATLASGSTVIPLPTTAYRSYIDGGLAVIQTDALNGEVVEIQSVNSTSLTLVRPTTQQWDIPAKVYPAVAAQMEDENKVSQITSDLVSGTLRFNVLNNVAVPAVDGATLHQGLSILVDQPNMAENADVDYQSKIERVDFQIADAFIDDLSGLNDQVNAFKFYVIGKDEIWRWREMFHARQGKFSKFYMPAWSRDFTVVQLIASSDTAIEVEDLRYRDFYALHPVKSDVMIKTKQGTFYRHIIGSVASATPGQELLSIDSALGVNVKPEEVIIMSFMHPSRLDSDTVEISWNNVEQVELAFNTRAIEQ